jgi:hypothetical protein
MRGALSSSRSHAVMTAVDYYRHPSVRTRIRDYCGAADGRPFSCAYVAALKPGGTHASWESAELHPPGDLPELLEAGVDLARSMWDTESLIFYLDLDYLNPDHPEEPFLYPADVFFKLEPVYKAARQMLHSFGIDALEIVTGRGHHFSGRIPWTHPVIRHLAELAPEVPAWHATLATRKPAWLTHTLDERQAQASFGLGLLIEHVAHLIMQRAAPHASIPVMLNGTEVGAGLTGRACVSIDFSHAGDPLDVRHMRVAFGTYQLHQLRPDIFGATAARHVPMTIAVPRGQRPQSLYRLLTEGRTPAAAVRAAERQTVVLPDVSQGVATLLVDYLPSRLAAFHREYFAVRPHPPDDWPQTYDRFDSKTLAPCVAWPLDQPNDRLLQPAHIQNLTRGLMAEGWQPRHIAGLVHSRYARDHGWGTRWTRQDARTRAEFDVRVFAGLVATGLDTAIDFNCVSAQEKGICPHAPTCRRDLRVERAKLLEGTAGHCAIADATSSSLSVRSAGPQRRRRRGATDGSPGHA